MSTERPIGTLSRLSAGSLGVFRGNAAVALGVSRNQLSALVGAGVIERELLVANGISSFTRELPLVWNGRVHRFDFAFEAERAILETNGRRWHDDATDYEHDNDKWSVPGRHGYRVVLAT